MSASGGSDGVILELVVKWGVPALCGLLSGALLAYLRKLRQEQKALRNGTQSLLRADIIRSYEKYLERGYCPIYARDALEREYEAYHGLGGNGTITDLWNMIKALPTEAPEKKK